MHVYTLHDATSKAIMRVSTVPLDLNFTYARAQKATARNIHGNALE